jgi:hypothetical protein
MVSRAFSVKPLYAGLLMRSIDGLTVHGDAVLAFFHEVYVGVKICSRTL